MNKKIALENFHALIEKAGLIKAVCKVFGNAVVKMPLVKTVYDKSIDELGLSTRSWNCLRRNGIVKIDQLLAELQQDNFYKQKKFLVISYRNNIAYYINLIKYDNKKGRRSVLFFILVFDFNNLTAF